MPKTREIKVYETGNYVLVSCESERQRMIANNTFDEEDEFIAYYVSDNDFYSLSDEELEKMVNIEAYDWRKKK